MTTPKVLWIACESEIHGSGLFATKDLKKGQRIIEYVGEKISKEESYRRADKQLKKSNKSDDGAVYIFEIDEDHDIDGNVEWNPARLINHSCDPNCEASDEDGRIWIESVRKIKKGEELSYNYGYDLEHFEDHPCRCGSRNCVGYIVKPEEWKQLKKALKRKSFKKKKSK
ncbi:MAG: SET domain-containing protein-lysine N-methyltransferase [Verrucomicrobiota bacterium]